LGVAHKILPLPAQGRYGRIANNSVDEIIHCRVSGWFMPNNA
jgi:hypothetical protein